MFKVAIITSSDSGYKGEREDRSVFLNMFYKAIKL